MLTLIFLLLLLILLCYITFKLFNGKDSLEINTTNDDAIFISGCDSGIGLELAKRLHDQCNFKIVCGFLSLDNSQGYDELVKVRDLDKSNRLILTKVDITSELDVANLKHSMEEWRRQRHFKNLIALINNAGIMAYGEFDWLTWEQMLLQIEVNLVGTIRLTRALLPYIIESKGRIINVSSVNDATVFPGLSIYSATKSAQSILSRGLGYEMRKFDVRVITIRLGDFARLTNIMSRHQANRDVMWNQMSQEKKELYGDYFHNFNDHLLKNYGMTSPKEFKDSSLVADFRLALLSKNPPLIITCTPISFRIFYYVIELMPIQLQYKLLDYLIQFGFNWKPTTLSAPRKSKQG